MVFFNFIAGGSGRAFRVRGGSGRVENQQSRFDRFAHLMKTRNARQKLKWDHRSDQRASSIPFYNPLAGNRIVQRQEMGPSLLSSTLSPSHHACTRVSQAVQLVMNDFYQLCDIRFKPDAPVSEISESVKGRCQCWSPVMALLLHQRGFKANVMSMVDFISVAGNDRHYLVHCFVQVMVGNQSVFVDPTYLQFHTNLPPELIANQRSFVFVGTPDQIGSIRVDHNALSSKPYPWRDATISVVKSPQNVMKIAQEWRPEPTDFLGKIKSCLYSSGKDAFVIMDGKIVERLAKRFFSKELLRDFPKTASVPKPMLRDLCQAKKPDGSEQYFLRRLNPQLMFPFKGSAPNAPFFVFSNLPKKERDQEKTSSGPVSKISVLPPAKMSASSHSVVAKIGDAAKGLVSNILPSVRWVLSRLPK